MEAGEYVLSFRWDCEQTSQVTDRNYNCKQIGKIKTILLVDLERLCKHQNCLSVSLIVTDMKVCDHYFCILRLSVRKYICANYRI